MLVNFLGSPQSGKTTTAAMLFAKLKENHMVAEFVLEQARLKIAENRFKTGESSLTTEDQLEIFNRQTHCELVMASKSNSIVISDSSPINNLIYLPDDGWKKDLYRIGEVMKHLYELKPLVFLCQPIDNSQKIVDMNRIHSLNESIQLHSKFNEINGFFNLSPVQLFGTPEQRLALALQTVYDRVSGVK